MGVGRPEHPLDPQAGPVQRLAWELRQLRQQAGKPTYRRLSQQAHYSVTTLADAAKGDRLPSLEVTLAYVIACGGDPVEWESRWHSAVAESQSSQRDSLGNGEEQAPYLGLASFQPESADRFFGRERIVAELERRLASRRFLAVVGASGCGKSSLLRAGLIPALPGTTRVVLLTPGAKPLQELAIRLAGFAGADVGGDLEAVVRQELAGLPPEAEIVFIVDQFEEVFTLCSDDRERDLFIDALLTVAGRGDSRARVVLGVRADFYGRCAEHAGLVAAMQDAELLVGPMTPDELTSAITQPAARCGVVLEKALTTAVLEDVAGQAGSLPLLSHALLETWRHRRGSSLTLAGYVATGGVRGAVAQTADRAYAALDRDQQLAARRILLRLIVPGEDTEDTRRRVSRAEFDDDPHTTAALDELVRARLLTLGENTVEIAHEALIRNWPSLRGWIDEDRELLIAQRRLTEAAAEWERGGRDDEFLYRRARLTAWEDRDLGRLNDSERVFLEVSRQREDRERALARHRSRRTLIAAGVALVVVSLLSVLALVSANQATQQRDLALSRQLVANARAQLGLNPELALLLARQAYRIRATEETEAMLRQATIESRLVATVPAGQGEVYSVAFDPDRKHLASAGTHGTLRIWDRAGTSLAQHEPVVVPGRQREAAKLAFAVDGNRLASAGEDGVVRIRDRVSGDEVLLRGHQGAVRGVAFTADGKLLASAGNDGTVRVWDANSGRETVVLRGHEGPVWTVAFTGDGRLASGGDDGTVRVWNIARAQQEAVIRAHDDTVKRLAFSRDGRLATASDDGTVKIWKDLGQSSPLVLRGQEGTTETLAFSPDGTTVASGGQDGVIRVASVDNPVDPMTLRGHRGVVWDLAYDPDAPSRLVSAGSDGTIRFWDVTGPGDPVVLRGHTGRVAPAEFSGDGRKVVTGGRDATVRVWRSTGDDHPVVLRGHEGEVWDVTFSADGRRVASSGQDGTVRVWNGDGSGEPVVLRGHEGEVWDVAFSPDGRHVASAGEDGTVRIWTFDSNDVPVVVLRGHERSVYNVSYSPDGSRLASAGVDGTVRVWNADNTGEPVVLRGHQGGARSAMFSPDGKQLVTASADGVVRIWRSLSDRDPFVLEGHQGPVASAVFSPDGQRLATNGSDRTVRIWKTNGTGDFVVVKGFGTSVSSLSFSPDGTKLLTAHGDGTARISRCDPCLPVADAVKMADSRISRDFTSAERKTFLNE
ncbi:nSTAND1 domain-containing NTPase [Lentzea sp. NPDC054927]